MTITIEAFQTWLDQWTSEEQVLAKCRELGIKGEPGDECQCLLANLIEREFPGANPIVGGDLTLSPDGQLSMFFDLPEVFNQIIEKFDTSELDPEFYQ